MNQEFQRDIHHKQVTIYPAALQVHLSLLWIKFLIMRSQLQRRFGGHEETIWHTTESLLFSLNFAMSNYFFILLLLVPRLFGVNSRKRKFWFHEAFLLSATPLELTYGKALSSATSPCISTHYPHSTSSALLPTSLYPVCLKHALSIAHAGLMLPCLTFFLYCSFSCSLHFPVLSCTAFFICQPLKHTFFFFFP